MKLKFRADAKDITIFLIFCVVLLYLCAIAILNLSEFSKYGTFFGLNPLPAFSKEFIGPTFVVFGFALAAIIFSVQSLFFEREKGFGISTDAKKEKGYSRWCTDKEMKKELKEVDAIAEKSEAAGIPIINNGKKIWVDDGEYHNLVIGSTGAGKTEMTIQPMVKLLAKHGESMIITDPKGEIYEKNALELKEKGYNIVLLNFRNPQNGNCWNPLTLPYQLYTASNQDKACELLEDLASNILYDENNKGGDPFWEKTSADYFAGLALALFKDAKAEEINLNSINLMTTAGEDKIGNTTYIKEYFSDKDQGSPEYINVASTLMAPNETKSSILSVFKQKIKLFSSRENLSEMLSHSDFDMHDIGRKKTAVFIVIQDEKKTYHSLVTIFLKQCYETLISVAQENGGRLPYRTNFILDEFANMPPLKDVTTMVTAARSRKIRFTFVIQNFAQLYEVYGKENGETIKGNCGNIIYLISSELNALEEISKLCGEVKSKDKEKTSSTPLVTVSDLQRLPKWTMIVIRIRMMPYKTKLTPNYEMVNNNNWGKNYGLATYPIREKGIVQTFDIKKFVDKKKEEKVTAMLNNITGGTSRNFDSGFNPFAGNQASPMPKGPAPGGFDVDEMVRRIDAKIAELEAEEALEKEKLAKKNEPKQQLDVSEIMNNVGNNKISSASEEKTNTVPIVAPESEASSEDNSDEGNQNNIFSEVNANETTPLAQSSSAPTSNGGQFFDFIVPVEEKEEQKIEEIKAPPKIEEETTIADTIVPVGDDKQELEPISTIPEDQITLEPTIENIDIPTLEETKSVTVEEPPKVVNETKEETKVSKPNLEVEQQVPVEKTIETTVETKSDLPNEIKIERNIDNLEAKVINNNYITDDQFFDDFFNDDDE